ncbi:uncharacterized protein EDB91DRAFT_206227 [Suillus paluster]|uniref:uncharacterized protein n=1 Tax=Suillus paluster TaxID=48578 RepID=UPI001B85F6C7|nr:uncharacterized protein EDB91DRAFT_206227 [Suillus paluster]KAG1743959.1 hypothetical protein EDB91DRAFT_206227 [Suillus paluster]
MRQICPGQSFERIFNWSGRTRHNVGATCPRTLNSCISAIRPHVQLLPSSSRFFQTTWQRSRWELSMLRHGHFGGDVKSLQKEVARGEGLPLPLVKHIMSHTLCGLARMHELEIVHTDLEQGNIIFDMGSLTQADIAVFIEANPARRHPPEQCLSCVVQAAVSQPLPLPSLAEAMTHNYIVADFGSDEEQFVII